MRAVKTRDLSDAMLLKYKKQIDDEVARRFAAKPLLELGPGDWDLPPELKKQFKDAERSKQAAFDAKIDWELGTSGD